MKKKLGKTHIKIVLFLVVGPIRLVYLPPFFLVVQGVLAPLPPLCGPTTKTTLFLCASSLID